MITPSMSSVHSSLSSEKKKKVYYSARGGARSKGADNAARANAAAPPQPILEAPLPRDTSSHFARGGEGNGWDYVIEDGVLERALEMDIVRVQEIRWEHYRMAKTGLRGGARIPRPKKDGDKPKRKHRFFFRRNDNSLGSIEVEQDHSPVPPSPTNSRNPLQERLFELSIASSDEAALYSLSDFSTPSFIIANNDSDGYTISEQSVSSDQGDSDQGDSITRLSSLHSLSIVDPINHVPLVSAHPTVSTTTMSDMHPIPSSIREESRETRGRSLSISSLASEDSFSMSEASASSLESYGRFSFIAPGVLLFRPDGGQPLTLNDGDVDATDLSLKSASAAVGTAV